MMAQTSFLMLALVLVVVYVTFSSLPVGCLVLLACRVMILVLWLIVVVDE